MVVAVVTVGMMEVSVDQVVDMVSMGDGFVFAAGTVDMTRIMTRATMVGGAAVGVDVGDRDHVFIDVVAVGVMEVSIMEIINMAVVHDGCMSAARSVDVVVVGVNAAISHGGKPIFVESVGSDKDLRDGQAASAGQVECGRAKPQGQE